MALDLVVLSTDVLLASIGVLLSNCLGNALLVIVELLYLYSICQQRVSLTGLSKDATHQLLIVQVETPVALKVVPLGIILGQLERTWGGVRLVLWHASVRVLVR